METIEFYGEWQQELREESGERRAESNRRRGRRRPQSGERMTARRMTARRVLTGAWALSVVGMTLLVPAAVIQLMGAPEAGEASPWLVGAAAAVSSLWSIFGIRK